MFPSRAILKGMKVKVGQNRRSWLDEEKGK